MRIHAGINLSLGLVRPRAASSPENHYRKAIVDFGGRINPLRNVNSFQEFLGLDSVHIHAHFVGAQT